MNDYLLTLYIINYNKQLNPLVITFKGPVEIGSFILHVVLLTFILHLYLII